MFTNHQMARVFEHTAEHCDAQCNPYTMRRRAQAIAAMTHGLTLEVGGGLAPVLQAMGDRSRAFHSDIAAPTCRMANKRVGRPSACFDAEQIPLGNATMDTIVSIEMISYLRRPHRFVAEAYRILRPGGTLVLSSKNPMTTLLDRGRSLMRKIGIPGLYFDESSPRFPSLARLNTLLTDAGFLVESTRGIVPLPFRFAHLLNLGLEGTPLHRLALFLIFAARKPFP